MFKFNECKVQLTPGYKVRIRGIRSKMRDRIIGLLLILSRQQQPSTHRPDCWACM